MVREVKPSLELIEERFSSTQFIFDLESVEKPKAIIVAGVSGSGKSTLIREFQKVIKNYFPIQADDYRRSHPKITQFIEKYGREEAHKKTGNFSHRMATALLNKACEQKFNVIYETTFNKLETVTNLLDKFKAHYYQISIIALPANVELSIKRNQQRYLDKLTLDGTLPRIVEKEVIIRMAKNYQQCLDILKQDKMINIYTIENSQMAIKIVAEFL